ncbi:MAG: P-II family nitrogen regulator [Pseudomonadales bacterium]
MSIKRITAIMPVQMLDPLEEDLRRCGVPGVTVEHVRGYGVHPNFFRRDLMRQNVRLVLYSAEDRVETILEALTSCAKRHGVQSGIVAVESIERLVMLGQGADVDPAEL